MRQFIILLILAAAVFFGYSWVRDTAGDEQLFGDKQEATADQKDSAFLEVNTLLESKDQEMMEQGLRAMEQAALAGSLDAQLRLGFGHALNAHGTAYSLDKARVWLKKAAGQGDKRAGHYLNIINAYDYELTPMRLLETTYADDLVRQAGRGDIDSQALLGRVHMMDMHQAGIEGMKKGRSWLTLAAQGGDDDSERLLEIIDMVLEASPKDLAKIQNQAEGGDAKSQAVLGMMYVHGIGGVAQDPKPARKWLLMAAEQGDDAATEYLRFLNREMFLDAVMQRLRKDALRGDNQAKVTLAYVNLFGFWGIPHDLPLAKRLAELASKAGSDEGRKLLDFIRYIERENMRPDPAHEVQ